MALGWLCAAGLLRAEVPMDLDSPFVQTILIQETTGEIAEKAVRKGQIKGELIELEKEEGGLLVLPRKQVIGVLPRLPQRGVAFQQIDAQRALQVLRQAQGKFPQRSEVRAEIIADWEKLSATKTEHDEAQTAALDKWLVRSSQLSSDTAPEELERIKLEGNAFLNKFPGRAREIEGELKGLKELGGIDLKQIDSVQFELGPLGESFVVGAVLWALLIIPLVVALKTFSDGLRGFREGIPLAGGLRVLIGGLALAFLVLLMTGRDGGMGSSVFRDKAVSNAARKAGWFSINHQEKWANQALRRISLPASDWLAFLEKKIVVGAGSDSFPFCHLAKPEIFKKDSSLVLLQSVQLKFIALPFRFYFALPQAGQSLTDLELCGASMGKIPLGTYFGQLVWNIFHPSYQPLAEKWGLNQGIRWLAGEGDTVVVEVPPTKKPKPQAKESLSARELAEVFDQGFGEIYYGKVITVEGALVEVSSIQETLGDGTKLEKQDPMDEFTLEGIPEGVGRKYALRVRCQFKCGDAFFLDAKGDLFKSAPQAQNPSSDIPILRKRDGLAKVRISSGRVESKSSESRLITLYDCRKVEGFDGKEWILIWGN
jgi:hypothetical protein